MQLLLRRLISGIGTGRLFHTSISLNINPRTVEEVRIPVPWGHIAGKWWGSKNIQPIIAIHGWLDNAGSFDPFAIALPENFSLLAIDVPGNGLSSHLPPFQNYGFVMASCTLLPRIKKYFKFDKLSLIGHSAGSTICFLHSTLYPEDVSSYFGIDYLLYACKNELKRAENIGKLMDNKIKRELCDSNKARSYTFDEAKQKWVTCSVGSLTDKSAEFLVERGKYRTSAGKVLFSRDDRLKDPELSIINCAQAYALAENIKCDVAIIKATKSRLFDASIKNCPDLLNIIEKGAKSFQFLIVEGNHYVHMDIPEKIVELYLDFKKNVKEQSKHRYIQIS